MLNTFNLYVYETPTKVRSYENVSLCRRIDMLVAKDSDGTEVFSCRPCCTTDSASIYGDYVSFFTEDGMVLIQGINYEHAALEAIWNFTLR